MGMSAGAAVIDFEITGKLSELARTGRRSALVLFRLHGRPLGWGAGRVTDGRLDGGSLVRQFLSQHAWTCALPLAERAMQSGRPLRMLDATTLMQSPASSSVSGPLVTVAVRSRTAASRLQPCLDSLLRLDYPSLDLVLSMHRRIASTLKRSSVTAIRKSDTRAHPVLEWPRVARSPNAAETSSR